MYDIKTGHGTVRNFSRRLNLQSRHVVTQSPTKVAVKEQKTALLLFLAFEHRPSLSSLGAALCFLQCRAALNDLVGLPVIAVAAK